MVRVKLDRMAGWRADRRREWTQFTPSANRNSPHPSRLGHWVRVTDDDPHARGEWRHVACVLTGAVDYFGSFNLHGPSVMEYSQFEYDQHLVDPNWSSHETAYLFDLLRTFDLRFVVAADRYEYLGLKGDQSAKKRSIEEIKDRYYTICRRLVRTRTASDVQAQQQQIVQYSFDKAREIKRKQYASELFHLTQAEIAEEEALYMEIKRLEQNEKRYRADRDELMRTIIGLDSGLVNLDGANSEGVLGLDRVGTRMRYVHPLTSQYKKKRRPEDETPGNGPGSPAPPAAKKQKDSAAFDLTHCIYRVPPQPIAPNSSHLASKHPVHQPAHLRSSKMPTPKPNTAIRVTELLSEMGLNIHRLVMPTRSNLDALDGVLHAAAALVDMKRQVDRVEQEIRTVKAQREGFVPPVEPSRKVSRRVACAREATRAARVYASGS